MSKIKNLVYLVALYSSTLYFSIITLFGRNGFSVELSTDDYVGIIAIIDALAALYLFRGIITLKKKSGRLFVMMIVPILVCVSYFGGGASNRLMINSYLAFSIPCTYIAIDVAGRKSVCNFSKWLEVLMLIVTASLVIILPRVILERDLTFEYQSYSYFAGFAFCVNFFFLIFGDRFDRFRVFKSRIYYFISIALLLVQAAASLISGGRGGFLLVIVSLFLFTLLSRRYSSKKKRSFALVFFLAVIVIFFLFMPSSFFDAMTQGSLRTFSYISGGNLDISQTSGRDEVYVKAISLIKEQPLLGYGFFSYFDYLKYYPHNIFLEVLLQGGLFYLFFFVCFLFYIIRKLIIIVRRDDNNLIIVLMALWPTVELLFSASYVMFGMFWFIVSYVVCYDLTPYRHTRKSILASQNC